MIYQFCCITDIDDCASGPCHNGATCHDGVDSFTCTCPVGFVGDVCNYGKISTLSPFFYYPRGYSDIRLRACLRGGGGPQPVGEVTPLGGVKQ